METAVERIKSMPENELGSLVDKQYTQVNRYAEASEPIPTDLWQEFSQTIDACLARFGVHAKLGQGQ